MEVLDLIYNKFFFMVNSFEYQPTPLHFIYPVPSQTLIFAATATHCALSEYAIGKKIIVMLSKDA